MILLTLLFVPSNVTANVTSTVMVATSMMAAAAAMAMVVVLVVVGIGVHHYFVVAMADFHMEPFVLAAIPLHAHVTCAFQWIWRIRTVSGKICTHK